MTSKDILYALQYQDERLVLQTDGHWLLEPSNQRVPSRVADEAKNHREVTGYQDARGQAVYIWGREAA